ncbi:MAG: rRNA maturation RNase YbeY [Candidatus Sungbacteria bacterium]|nr:rRNA maturation RNase YbeY [Candidatus Sungbacteria bacterium]
MSVVSAARIRRMLPAGIVRKLPKKVLIIRISAKESTRLNAQYRNKPLPTNVLSFRYGPAYGEVLLCPAVIRAEAKQQGNSYDKQMTWMIIHGMLHLAGLHHERSEATRKRVEQLEQKLLGIFKRFLAKPKIQRQRRL